MLALYFMQHWST